MDKKVGQGCSQQGRMSGIRCSRLGRSISIGCEGEVEWGETVQGELDSSDRLGSRQAPVGTQA